VLAALAASRCWVAVAALEQLHTAVHCMPAWCQRQQLASQRCCSAATAAHTCQYAEMPVETLSLEQVRVCVCAPQA
jgi:hypothetical protein